MTNTVSLPSFSWIWDVSFSLNCTYYFIAFYRFGPTDVLYPSPAPHLNIIYLLQISYINTKHHCLNHKPLISNRHFLNISSLLAHTVATYISDSCSKSVNTTPEHYGHQRCSTCALMLSAHDPIYNTIIQNFSYLHTGL